MPRAVFCPTPPGISKFFADGKKVSLIDFNLQLPLPSFAVPLTWPSQTRPPKRRSMEKKTGGFKKNRE